MTVDRDAWNVPLIQNIFNEQDVSLITSLPFSKSRSDRLTWKFDTRGICTVKSGYIELMRSSNRAYVDNTALNCERWRWEWKLCVTPKVRLFMWRVLQGIIPTNVNLITRFVNVEPDCM